MKNEEFATAAVAGGERKWSIKNKGKKSLTSLLCAAIFILHSSFFISCSEDDNTVNEYENWQQRNEQFFATLQDSLSQTGAQWLKLKKYSLDQKEEGVATDYIYVKVLTQSDTSSTSPHFTDSVRVAYQGRLIPTTSYPEGYVFDTTIYGSYSMETVSTAKLLVSGVVDGFSTALQHMHRGDRWRVYIPHQLGYQSSVHGSVPAYSTLIFDLTLVDFTPAGTAMPIWKSPRR